MVAWCENGVTAGVVVKMPWFTAKNTPIMGIFDLILVLKIKGEKCEFWLKYDQICDFLALMVSCQVRRAKPRAKINSVAFKAGK